MRGNKPIMTYEQWKEMDSTFDLIIDIIYKLNRGEKGDLETHLKKEYKKRIGDKK